MKRALKYIKPYVLLVITSFFLAIVSVLSKLYLPILIGQSIDCMITPAVEFDLLLEKCKWMAITITITFISQWAMGLVNQKATYRICEDIRNDAFSKILQLPISYLDTHPVGQTTNKVINDVDTFSDGLLMGFTNFFSSVLTILATLFFMFRINTQITLIVVILTPLSLIAARFVTKNTYNLFVRQSEIKAQQSSLIDEMIQNQKVVLAFNQKKNVCERFDQINKELADTAVKATFFSSLTNPVTRFVNAIVYAVLALQGAKFALAGAITIGSLSSFLSYATQYTKPFNEISDVIVELQNAIACGNRVFDLIDQPCESSDENKKDIEVLNGDVTINDIVFGYNKSQPILNHMSFTAYKGHKIAIVGTTGCGKTTLINLLMRFYDPDQGTIQIDGCSSTDLKRSSIRKNIGMVLQESWLKQATIKENLLFGNPDASDDQIVEACKKCHIHSFIMRLPDGYDTYLKENDGIVSAGQKQLLCIARIMIANPNIIVLDEATSAIDTRTEIKVQQAFDQLTANRTSFIVAHRLSTIKNADVILVMDKGKIIEEGNHQQLLEKKGFYFNLYNSQFNQTN